MIRAFLLFIYDVIMNKYVAPVYLLYIYIVRKIFSFYSYMTLFSLSFEVLIRWSSSVILGIDTYCIRVYIYYLFSRKHEVYYYTC